MVMMPPTIVVAAASAPTVMMTSTVMAPPMPVSMTALDLDDNSIGAAESMRCCGWHGGRGSCRSKATECSKSNKCKLKFHAVLL
jgi:hypothetical protein